MAVEAKPLFRPDVLRPRLDAFDLPASVEAFAPKLQHWAALLTSKRADRLKEKELLPDFLTDFFVGLLGYTGPAHGLERYTLSRERHVRSDGTVADAVLGEFNGEPHHVVAVEGKGPRDPLDRPFGRPKSAVDQGYDYAINLRCDWIVVTSMRQTRLYFKGADKQSYERFDTERLADDAAFLKRFLFLLGADRVVPAGGRCHLYDLLTESERVGRELTREYYARYADMRREALAELRRDNPDVPAADVLAGTQKLLDRVLFCAFAEDRGLLPDNTIKNAFEHRDPYNPRPVWHNFRGLFRQINHGDKAHDIHRYNGGLFAEDAVLDGLNVSDSVCSYFRDLGTYDYKPPHESTGEGGSLIDVDILGHIFEQSITDLERLQGQLSDSAETIAPEKPTTRRKAEGAFYTPSFVTRYIVDQALGGVLRDRFEQLRAKHWTYTRGAGRKALDNPHVYTLDTLKKTELAALVKFWEAWQDELAQIRLLDPACGSGAFLIEAFDQLYATYEASNDRLQELRGHRTLFDLDRRILENNLYGVDLNHEAIEICRLSLWIKTAERGKVLTSLDHTIRVGNSIVADAAVHPKAFDWPAEFPEVFDAGGFDVVVGNPPYVRQELLSAIKPYLQANYQAFHGMADLYVYFYELGMRLLKPGGLLSFVVTNKWMKAGYGEPLRRLLREQAWVQSVVDFGHAKQIFPDADVFPSIIVARRPSEQPAPRTARLCSIPREQLRIDDLSRQIAQEGFDADINRLGAEGWEIEPDNASSLLEKLRTSGTPLTDYCGATPLYGVKTGLNAAFLIDSPARDKLVAADPNCSLLIKPYFRGQDIDRWDSDWAGLWMIFIRRGTEINAYPSIKRHLEQYRRELEPRPRDWDGNSWPGRKPGNYRWYEIQDPVEYWSRFEQPKIVYQDIMWRPHFSLDERGTYSNNTTYILPSDDPWLLVVLNSAAAWWFAWKTFRHGKDEALRMFTDSIEQFPIPESSDSVRSEVDRIVRRLIEMTRKSHELRRTIRDWLRIEHEIEKPSLKLQSPTELDSDAFVAEVKKARGRNRPLSAAALKSLRDEYTRTIVPGRQLAAEALNLERRTSDLVNEAYGLTPDEVALMWDTAPPRMPIPRP